MSAPKPFPPYPKKPRKFGGGARIQVNGRAYYLGKHGSEESYREYERLRLEHADGAIRPKLRPGDRMTLAELVATWSAEEPRGREHPEVERIARACVPLVRLHGHTVAAEFRASRLRTVQESMVSRSWMTDEERKGRDWSRQYINKQIERIVRVFRWAESRDLVPFGTTEHLRTLPDLEANDRRVRSTRPRQPVDWESQVKPALPFMPIQIRAMLTVQYHAGMRPGEVCEMRRCEVDQAGDVWLYRPEKHKNAWRGDGLTKVIGPQAQAALAPWLLAAEPEGYVFPPARRATNGHDHYDGTTYAQAVRRAVESAKVKPWTAYSLRHAAKQKVTRAYGLDAARAFLGQSSIQATDGYAHQQDVEKAADIARKIG